MHKFAAVRYPLSTLWVFIVFLCGAVLSVEAQESGYQVINGTRVFTQIDHASDTATFSNECGRQTLTHAELGAGAIPTRIIPCPRPSGTRPSGGGTTTARRPQDTPGSFSRSCENCTASAGGMTCNCRRINQTYVRTSIDPGRCKGGDVENSDGQLRCTYGETSTADAAAPTYPTGRAPARSRKWGALAAGIHEGFLQNYVNVGSSINAGSEDEATRNALSKCTDSDVPDECRIVTTFNSGCGYISTGHSGKQVGWGSGNSAQAAMNRCESRGLDCRQPIGGCID